MKPQYTETFYVKLAIAIAFSIVTIIVMAILGYVLVTFKLPYAQASKYALSEIGLSILLMVALLNAVKIKSDFSKASQSRMIALVNEAKGWSEIESELREVLESRDYLTKIECAFFEQQLEEISKASALNVQKEKETNLWLNARKNFLRRL